MRNRLLIWRPSVRAGFLAVGALLVLTSSSAVRAQQQLSKRYPAGKNVRIELKNISGTIIVETWKKDEIRLSATIESKHAQVIPRQIDQSLVVDVMSDNRGKGDVGDINFKLQVPVNSNVDLETRRGNILPDHGVRPEPAVAARSTLPAWRQAAAHRVLNWGGLRGPACGRRASHPVPLV